MEDNKDQLFEILSGSKEKASDNLKYRIMHQVQTESALSRKEKKTSNPFWSTVIPVLAVMYGVIAIVLGGFYFLSDKASTSINYVSMVVLFIILVSSVYLFISVFDEKRNSKRLHKKNKQ